MTSTGRDRVWSSIAECLTRYIVSGQLPSGSRIPSEHALATQFGVNRHTVRRALSSLASQGLVRMVHGSGTYVQDFALDLVLGKRTRHSHSLALAGVRGRLLVLAHARVRANADVARALGVQARSRVLQLNVLGEGKSRPLHVSQRWFPLPRFNGLEAWVEQTGSITQAFGALGVPDYVRRESRIAATLPDAVVAQALMQPMQRPVLQVHSVNTDLQGRPIEYAVAWFSGDRVTLTVRHDA